MLESYNGTLSASKPKKRDRSGLYSIVQKGHKIKPKKTNGDYCRTDKFSTGPLSICRLQRFMWEFSVYRVLSALKGLMGLASMEK